MSYNYSHSNVTVSAEDKLNQICYDYNVNTNVQNAQREAENHLEVLADIDYSNGYPQLTLISQVRVSEHEGFDALVQKLQNTLFAYADKGTYIVSDELGNEREVVVS